METRSNFVLVGAVTLALLVGTLLFIVWLSGVSSEERKCYDIYFAQGVGGLNKGSNVSFAGVPVGQISKISLLPNRPEFVWVRIDVDQETPVLQGTTAQIKGVGFTGVSEIQLQGAVKGARPIRQMGPEGCPVIPASSGGLGALLNSAPELLERIQKLTERLTELLSDRTRMRSPTSWRISSGPPTCSPIARRSWATPSPAPGWRWPTQASRPSRVAALSDSTNRLVIEEGRPAAQDLRRAIASVQRAADNLDAVVADARPGVQNFSKSTLPEANRLVRDMRELTQSLRGVERAHRARRHRRRARARKAARLRTEEEEMTPLLRLAGPLAVAVSLAGCSLARRRQDARRCSTTSRRPRRRPARSPARRARRTRSRSGFRSSPRNCASIRVPVQVSPTQVEYVKDMQWVDTPDRLFQGSGRRDDPADHQPRRAGPAAVRARSGHFAERRAAAVRLRCAARARRCPLYRAPLRPTAAPACRAAPSSPKLPPTARPSPSRRR